MGAGLKKDLRVSKVGPEGLLMPSFFLLIGVISKKLAMVRKKGETSTLGERNALKSCAMIHFTNDVFVSSLGWPSCAKEKNRIKEASDSFIHAPLDSEGYSLVGRASFLQLGRCDYGLDVLLSK
ncbi:hypothetical protein POTOM_006202 [Populus tomentosa]|uniref:Uncharacterized protein n=1 Tax=Populus tomentosa TaxID=118781 RepID=A0A8X8D770_POPTO|nr:hypothetical protein POTOM_006202 [Populus tomentosa]